MLVKDTLLYICKAVIFGLIMAAAILIFSPSSGKFFSFSHLFSQSNNSNQLSFSRAVREAAPSVVNIYSINIVTARQLDSSSLQNRSELQGLGSGVIMSHQGYILTNYHVVNKADEIVIILQDGRRFEAEVIGMDPATDLAVIKINGENLPIVPLDLDVLPNVGDVVLAIGNPYNVGQTITQGIISATGRNSLSSGYQEFLQTDAAINEGNSGGALINTNGVLIGINTAAFQVGGESGKGINFAIPTKLAYHIMEKLIESGRVIRGAIGFNGQALSLTPKYAQVLGLKNLEGVVATDIEPNSPAFHAQLRKGDVVIKYREEVVPAGPAGVWMLRDRIAETKPGTQVVLSIIRRGLAMDLTVTVAEKSTVNIPQQ
ncbi:outer membrane-stress sensor serine endopeptidase DegS [Parashewanella spongiae]|uniref:Outer membrane-stress sensor serine endopeptidase DegS n=1 Tax=Parashewanella spongiae TaxID=342950 RepID=A0A3A6TZK2_9GAMM|nr:outer membrane-stress sensor serine endopeptidase DegS [Parashewanella spongiae]MCL1077447.1 outer membrane-stress sensor serine endopeptidase DegS [Parashewanella spongiae]RJY18413.1 outer membrane-stress sensor serine endopeptidase DegS [Parashewanella spongiae]